MKTSVKIFFTLIVSILSSNSIISQDIKDLGLSDKNITSVKIGEGILAVGTNGNGVYWQTLNGINDSGWNKISVDSINVRTVYPHKSGPIGWAIGIGTKPVEPDSDFIYCSYLGSSIQLISYGIDTNYTREITRLDGFQDPSICGETFAIGDMKLYRRYFQDTVWHSVYDLTIEGYFEALKVRENFEYVYAGGGEGFANMLLIRSSDKGDSWENLAPLCYVAEVDFWNNADTTIFVTDRFRVLCSNDNGKTWENVFQSDSLMLQKITFDSNGSRFYAIANSNWYSSPRSYLLYTDDKGINWNIVQLPIYDIVVDMDIGYDDNLYVATTNNGIFQISQPFVDIKDESVRLSDFKLFDNFPNPFNSTTSIIYRIPVNCFVILKLFDILGNKIATLVNNEEQAGNYKIHFDADDFSLSSGIYFYSLQTGLFTDTKKMILLK